MSVHKLQRVLDSTALLCGVSPPAATHKHRDLGAGLLAQHGKHSQGLGVAVPGMPKEMCPHQGRVSLHVWPPPQRAHGRSQVRSSATGCLTAQNMLHLLSSALLGLLICMLCSACDAALSLLALISCPCSTCASAGLHVAAVSAHASACPAMRGTSVAVSKVHICVPVLSSLFERSTHSAGPTANTLQLLCCFCRCSNRSCGCPKFSFIVAEGSWVGTCD